MAQSFGTVYVYDKLEDLLKEQLEEQFISGVASASGSQVANPLVHKVHHPLSID